MALNMLRPSASHARPYAAVPQIFSSRTITSSTSSNPPPCAAAAIIDKLPSHPSLITKTGTAETVRYPYIENHDAPIKGVFDGARAEHMAQGAKDHIDKAGQMKDVVSFTKRVQSSKETEPLEADALIRHRVKARTLHTDSHLCGGQYPQYILTKAAELNNCNEIFETKYCPLYDKIFNYWFPPAEGYDVCPHWLIPGREGNKDSTITFVIEHHQHPFLLVDIQPPSEFQSGRCLAICNVICHLDDIGPINLHADRLYAISAIGKMWRACYTLKGNGIERGQCVKGIAESNSLRSGHPKCWNPDIMSNASWAALPSIVKTIKGYVV